MQPRLHSQLHSHSTSTAAARPLQSHIFKQPCSCFSSQPDARQHLQHPDHTFRVHHTQPCLQLPCLPFAGTLHHSRSRSKGHNALLLQVFFGTVVEGDPSTVGHVIQTVAGQGSTRQVISYRTERVVGNGSFGVVFQAVCVETGAVVRFFSLFQFRLSLTAVLSASLACYRHELQAAVVRQAGGMQHISSIHAEMSLSSTTDALACPRLGSRLHSISCRHFLCACQPQQPRCLSAAASPCSRLSLSMCGPADASCQVISAHCCPASGRSCPSQSQMPFKLC